MKTPSFHGSHIITISGSSFYDFHAEKNSQIFHHKMIEYSKLQRTVILRVIKYLIIIFCVCFTLKTFAAFSQLGLQNAENNQNYFVFSSQSSQHAACLNTCKNILKPNEQQMITIDNADGWIDLEYNICASSKDNACDDYRGHVGILFTPEKTTISNTKDGTASLKANGSNGIFTITFHSTIPKNTPPPTFPTPKSYSGVKYRGFNLSGGEFDSGFHLPYPADALYFVQKGANIFRIPFKWEYIQPDLNQPINFNVGNAKQLNDLVAVLTKAHIYVILDMHNFLRYPTEAFHGPVIGKDSPATTEKFALAWGSFATQFKNNQYVFFDLMNEPLADPDFILKNYQVVIQTIRARGFKNLLLLEGSDWSKMSTWVTKNGAYFTSDNIHDPENNYALSIHQYFDDAGGSTDTCFASKDVLTKIHFSDFLQWVKNQKMPVFLTELGGANNQNCANAIDTLLTAVENNSYQNHVGGFIGWTGWMGGHATAGFLLNLLPDSPTHEKTQMRQGFELHLKNLS
jgi:endoglucanase